MRVLGVFYNADPTVQESVVATTILSGDFPPVALLHGVTTSGATTLCQLVERRHHVETGHPIWVEYSVRLLLRRAHVDAVALDSIVSASVSFTGLSEWAGSERLLALPIANLAPADWEQRTGVYLQGCTEIWVRKQAERIQELRDLV
jgi:hypothetical protein